MMNSSTEESPEASLDGSIRILFVSGLSLLHAIVFAWAARSLPWDLWSTFSCASYGLAVLHCLTAIIALPAISKKNWFFSPTSHHRLRRAWPRIFRLTCWASILHAMWFGLTLFAAAKYIAELYGGLGQGVAIALVVALAGYFWMTLPFATWGLAKTPGFKWRRRSSLSMVVLIVLGVFLGASVVEPSSPEDAIQVGLNARGTFNVETILEELQKEIEAGPRPTNQQPSSQMRPVVDRGATVCDKAIDEQNVTLIFAHSGESICLQGSWSEVLTEFGRTWRGLESNEFVKIDVIVASQPMQVGIAWLDRLWIRPGQDGICIGGNCLMPWQLVARGLFAASRPIPAIRDLRIGVDPLSLRNAVNAGLHQPSLTSESSNVGPEDDSPWSSIKRISTISLLGKDIGQLNSYPQTPRLVEPIDQKSWMRSMARAEAFIERSQFSRGRFRYRLDPFSGRQDSASMSLPRQAGTTLAWCELAKSTPLSKRKEIAQKALRTLADYEIDIGGEGRAALSSHPGRIRVRLGDSALPLVAFLSCRKHVGAQFDGVITRLGKFLLAMQRPDGGFYPAWNLRHAAVAEGPEALYAVGQAIFALSLLEALASDTTSVLSIEPQELHLAVERAMDYVADSYWNHAARPFFFVEENWNCLAARASLGHHRHAGYEQFCLDYVQFKSRLLLDEFSEVRSDFWGAYGFGNIIPPHQTPAAGLAEALAAAMAIKVAMDRPIAAEQDKIASILQFLLRQQWDQNTCFACFDGRIVDGGFSESMVSPTIRIDFVQHAWSALGHGGQMLGFGDPT